MEYFCYISREKVDQLLASAGVQSPDTWTERQTTTTERKLGAGLRGVASVLSGDLSYGRSDVIQRDGEVKRSYVQKLRTLISHFAENIRPFTFALDLDNPTLPLYHLKAPFVVAAVDETHLIATLEPTHRRGSLRLHCSLEYFSERVVKDGRPFFNSTNFGFFEHGDSVTFDTTFLLTTIAQDRFVGSPLYLKLESGGYLLL